MSVPIGSAVDVLRKTDNGWWLVRYLHRFILKSGQKNNKTKLYLVSSGPKPQQHHIMFSKKKNTLFRVDINVCLRLPPRFNGKAGYIPSMYLQPYNNPRAGLYSRQVLMYSSNLNLADRRPSTAASVAEEPGLQLGSAAVRPVAGRLHKARSLDVLSETRTQAAAEGGASPTVGGDHDLTLTSSDFSLSSSDNESTSSLRGAVLEGPAVASSSGSSSPTRNIPARHDSSRSSQSSGSTSSREGSTSLVAPRVPNRPKTEEILTRCTTMTRKAAIATRSRLQNQPAESIYSR